jgi:hypothetical protein
LRFYLKLDLSEDESTLLTNTWLSFYGPTSEAGLEKALFIDFLNKSYIIKTFEQGNLVVAKQA